MKKFLLIILAAVTLYSCQKKESEPVATTQDVVFAAEWVDPGSLKSTNGDEFPCSPLSADYAWVKLNGQDYYPDIFTLDSKIYTQAIKLTVPSGGSAPVSITQFWLMHDNGTAGYGPDDVPVMGTPMLGSDFHSYVTQPLSFGFSVNAFEKAEIPVQVLCVQRGNINGFGFDWFSVDEIVVREMCFFGDVCLNGQPYTPNDYNGSLYGSNLGPDVPAIMRITVAKTVVGVTTTYPSTNNEGWLGIGAPLCVTYPDNIFINGEVFTFDLEVWVKKNGVFQYVNFYRFSCTDDGPFNVLPGADGVIDYVIGTCVYPGANITFQWPNWNP
jgi:hypothetical protein